MKVISTLAAILFMAAPAFAQSERGYVEGIGGFAVSASALTSNVTSADASLEAGIRIAPRLQVFADVGRFRDLTPATTQQTVTDTVTTLSSNDALDVVGTARTPAKYFVGGLRWEAPTRGRVSPFVQGGIGVARLSPAVAFSYTDGTIPNADPSISPPATGDNVTAPIVAAGLFTQPQAASAAMVSFGGGLEVALAKHWAVDSAYRFSRIAADTPLHAQGLTFGFGYRF